MGSHLSAPNTRQTDLVPQVIRASTTAGLMLERHLQFEVGADGELRTKTVCPTFRGDHPGADQRRIPR